MRSTHEPQDSIESPPPIHGATHSSSTHSLHHCHPSRQLPPPARLLALSADLIAIFSPSPWGETIADLLALCEIVDHASFALLNKPRSACWHNGFCSCLIFYSCSGVRASPQYGRGNLYFELVPLPFGDGTTYPINKNLIAILLSFLAPLSKILSISKSDIGIVQCISAVVFAGRTFCPVLQPLFKRSIDLTVCDTCLFAVAV